MNNPYYHLLPQSQNKCCFRKFQTLLILRNDFVTVIENRVIYLVFWTLNECICIGTRKVTSTKVSLSVSVIDTVIKTGNLRIVSVECHGDDTPLTFHDTPLSYYWYMLANLISMTLL